MLEVFVWPITILVLVAFFMILFRNEIGEFIKGIGWLRTRWFELRRIREEVFAKAEEVQKLSDELTRDRRELRTATKTFIESLYLILQTRNRFPMPEKVAQEIMNNLNLLASFAVDDEGERKTWLNKIQGLLNNDAT